MGCPELTTRRLSLVKLMSYHVSGLQDDFMCVCLHASTARLQGSMRMNQAPMRAHLRLPSCQAMKPAQLPEVQN